MLCLVYLELLFCFFHRFSDGLVFNRRTLAALPLNFMISLLLKNTIDLLLFSEHKLYGFPQSEKVKKSVVSVVTIPWRGFLVLKHVLKTICEIEWIEYGWLSLRKRKIETDSMLWLGFNKLLKVLIGNENMEMFMDDATLKVFFFNFRVIAQLC